jgi:hypothetical protein
MSDNNIDEAHLKDILTATYQPQREAEQTLAKRGYKYDPELSTMESKVFYNPETNKPHIAYRGSTRISDFAYEDPALAIGFKTEKQKKAEKLAKDVEAKYGQSANAYGHSLGGYRAEKSGASGNVFTFNKGAGIFDIGKKISDKQTDIRTNKDIVSALSLGQRGGTRKTLSTPLTTNVIASHSVSQLTNKPEQNTFESLKNKATSIASKVLKVPTIKAPKFSFK